MSTPRFSLVIPTRNRPRTLRAAVATCLMQEYDGFEIVVSDNCSGPETREVVHSLEGDKVTYVRSETPLAMSDNWELALSRAVGDYVILIGDDDGLLPGALTELDAYISTTGAKAIRWPVVSYLWPDVRGGWVANKIHIPPPAVATLVDSHAAIHSVIKGEQDYSVLPMLYHSAIHRDLIASLRRINGRVFMGSGPDVYSAFAMGYTAQTHHWLGSPMTVVGYSGSSNGVAYLFEKQESSIYKEFLMLNASAGYSPHSDIPDIPAMTAMVASDFLRAQAAVFPNDAGFALDRRALVINCVKDLESQKLTGADQWSKFMTAIHASVQDDAELSLWFERAYLQEYRPQRRSWIFSVEDWKDGYSFGSLFLDGEMFGISDVLGAAKLCGALLGRAAGPGEPDEAPGKPVGSADASAAAGQAERQDETQRLARWLADLQRDYLQLYAGTRRALEHQLASQPADANGQRVEEYVIRNQQIDLTAKEGVIQGFRNSYLFWLVNGPFRWIPGLGLAARLGKRILRFFMPRLGVLRQHAPRPLRYPQSYAVSPPLAPGRVLPCISLVTPSLNQGQYIERTIRSVLDQRYPCLEYIVQDGNSVDGTKDVLASLGRELTSFDSRPDHGQAHALNLAFPRASGEIMAYLNSDDILLPGALRYVADYFTDHPEVDVVYSHRVIIDEQDREIGRWLLPPHDDQVILWADYIPQETLFWRRRIWQKTGASLNESYHFALDWDLILRFRAAGARFERLPRFLAAFRLQADSKTNLELDSSGILEMQRVRAQLHGREVSWEEVNREIAPYLRRSLVYHILYRLNLLHH